MFRANVLTVRNYIACMTKLFQNTFVDNEGRREQNGQWVWYMGTALINEPRVESQSVFQICICQLRT